MSGYGAGMAPAGSASSGVPAQVLILLIQEFDARLKALEARCEARPIEARAMSELDSGELVRLEWELRAGPAEADADFEHNAADDYRSCTCCCTEGDD